MSEAEPIASFTVLLPAASVTVTDCTVQFDQPFASVPVEAKGREDCAVPFTERSSGRFPEPPFA